MTLAPTVPAACHFCGGPFETCPCVVVADPSDGCLHESTYGAETGPLDYRGRTEVYEVCEDCGATLDGPFPGGGVL